MKKSLGELEMKMLKNEIKTLAKIARKRIIEVEKWEKGKKFGKRNNNIRNNNKNKYRIRRIWNRNINLFLIDFLYLCEDNPNYKYHHLICVFFHQIKTNKLYKHHKLQLYTFNSFHFMSPHLLIK